MQSKNIYRDWGFTDNPFSIMPLPASEAGEKLLIGRESEVAALLRRVATPPNIPTVEGLNGMGKTSLVNVTVYRCFQDYLQEGVGPAFIPCRERFQLSDDIDPSDFAFEVLLEVAQTLISHRGELQRVGHQLPNVEEIDRWLNAPELASMQASVGAVLGVGYGRSAGAMGFNESGFKKIVKSWLKQIFPTDDSGGVVCVLDNIEIMRTSARAREIVEALRDPVLSIPGLRWVLCGALGIVYGIARSPRLQGILTHPVEVGPIEDQEPGRILQSRIETFALAPEDVFMPVSEKSFSFVFDLLRGHIRNVLSEMNSFCHWIADHGWQQKILQNSTWSRVLFDKWIKEKSLKALADSQEYVRPASWRRLDEIARAGGIVSMRDLLGLSLTRLRLRPTSVYASGFGVGWRTSTLSRNDPTLLAKRDPPSVLPRGKASLDLASFGRLAGPVKASLRRFAALTGPASRPEWPGIEECQADAGGSI